VIIDCSSNSSGWETHDDSPRTISQGCYVLKASNAYDLAQLEQLFTRAKELMNSQTPHQLSVLIDSIGVLQLEHSVGSIRLWLNRLQANTDRKHSRVVAILHTDNILSIPYLNNKFISFIKCNMRKNEK
jgi:hypothetical protein